MTGPVVLNIRDPNVSLSDGVLIDRNTMYGNPFRGPNRKENIRRFEEEVLPNLDVSRLRGKNLICHCKPKPCHGDPILKKANPGIEL
jgi:hypothetical protein